MIEAIMLIGLFGLIILVFAKTYNVLLKGNLYPKEMVWITTALMLISWLLMFTGYLGAISSEENADISTGTNIVLKENAAKVYLPLFSFGTLLVFLVIPLTIFEILVNTPKTFAESLTRFSRRSNPKRA